LQTDGGTQCFPLYIYSDDVTEPSQLFPRCGLGNDSCNDAITPDGLKHFQDHYADAQKPISKEVVFYYFYGLLHSADYRTRYVHNLSKELPRIPAVKTFEDFQKFAQAGRDLAHWHLNYETVECYPVQFELTSGATRLSELPPEKFRVVKMKHPKRKDPETGKSVNDRSTVIYNEYITVTGIPIEAYDYVVNGKSAIDWVMERQAVTTDKDSGIVNDANLWATETMDNPRYPLELLQRIITVSLQTVRIVRSLPSLDV
jgi:predicted helicase